MNTLKKSKGFIIRLINFIIVLYFFREYYKVTKQLNKTHF